MTTTIEDDPLILEVRRWRRAREMQRKRERELQQMDASLKKVRRSWLCRGILPAAACLPGFLGALLVAGKTGAAVWAAILFYGGPVWIAVCASKAAATWSGWSTGSRALSGFGLWMLLVAVNWALLIPMGLLAFLLSYSCC